MGWKHQDIDMYGELNSKKMSTITGEKQIYTVESTKEVNMLRYSYSNNVFMKSSQISSIATTKKDDKIRATLLNNVFERRLMIQEPPSKKRLSILQIQTSSEHICKSRLQSAKSKLDHAKLLRDQNSNHLIQFKPFDW